MSTQLARRLGWVVQRGCLQWRPRSGAAWSLLLHSAILVGSVEGGFGTVINVPPDDPPSAIDADTQLNLFDDGTISTTFFARSGSQLNVVGGVIADNLNIQSGSEWNLRGGTVGRTSTNSGSTVNFYGGDFRIDGQLIEGLENAGDSVPFAFPESGVLSGTLQDGTPFAFTSVDGDGFDSENFMLHAVGLPAVGPAMITASLDPIPAGIRGGQTLFVDPGGMVGDRFNAGWNSVVAVQAGGTVGDDFEATGATVAVSGADAMVGDRFGAFSGSVVSISGGGSIGNSARASGSRVDVRSGGAIDYGFRAFDSTVNVVGDGRIELPIAIGFEAYGSQVNVRDEAFVGRLYADDSVVNIRDQATVGGSSRAVGGTEWNLYGGSVDGSFGASGAETKVNVRGGSIGDSATVFSGAVNLSGGSIGNEWRVTGSGVVNVSGGSVGDGFFANSGSTVNLSGGTVGDRFFANTNSTVNISGGLLGDDFDANTGSAINLFGTDFLLDGEEIAGVIVGEPFEITERDKLLSGVLADGTTFEFDLNSADVVGADFFHAEATVTITLLSRLVGDYNDDGVVNAADFVVWRNRPGEAFTLPNEDPLTTPGEVTEDDYFVWRHNYGRAAGSGALSALPLPPSAFDSAVPEPTAAMLVALAGMACVGLRRKVPSLASRMARRVDRFGR